MSRAVTVGLVAYTLGSLFYTPTNPFTYVLDVFLRGYVMFLGTVMAHDAVHGNLGKSGRANLWWGRLALVPATVPFTNFRKTHMLHHAYTNEPDGDPDIFMKPRWTAWEIPFRALAMPHQWFFWLRQRNKLKRSDMIDLVFNYAGIFAIYGAVGFVVGPARLFSGMLPALLVVSVILWYPFAVKTHEGWALGDEALRSHDYYGAPLYWLTLGLSLHRVHHVYPKLSWVELRQYVRPNPGQGWRGFIPRRDVQVAEATQGVR
jgi:beta-carotene hydroxylase